MHICLSHILSQSTPSYGNRDKIFIRDNSSTLKGESANSSCWIFSNNHIGTHIDSPKHFSGTGKKTYEYAIDDYIFNNISFIEIPCNEAKLIGPEDFEHVNSISKEVEILLIRTGYEQWRGKDKYWEDNPGLAPELADYFRNLYPKLRCVGFDFISLTSWKFRPQGKQSHLEFLCPQGNKNSILVIEDMSLKEIENHLKKIIVAPLFIEDGNGGAVTVFAEI